MGMIDRNVVLVLGAGASKAYGFDTGGELLKRAISYNGDLVVTLEKFGMTEAYYNRFRTELNDAQLPSIDRFLEVRNDYMEIGKICMAFYLIKCENYEKLYSATLEQDWYRYIFQLMETTRFQDFFLNQLKVITFNYDRSFENYIFRALKAGIGHDKDDRKIIENINNLEIVHVHGNLGSLYPEGGNSRPYSDNVAPEMIKIAKNGIFIVSEADKLGKGYERAHKLIQRCETLLFLGFHYHPENVDRLRLGRNLLNGRINGTVVGFEDKEYEMRIRPQFENLPNDLGNNNLTALSFIKKNLDWIITPP